jgi:hypothetical protein
VKGSTAYHCGQVWSTRNEGRFEDTKEESNREHACCSARDCLECGHDAPNDLPHH